MTTPPEQILSSEVEIPKSLTCSYTALDSKNKQLFPDLDGIAKWVKYRQFEMQDQG